MIRYTVTGPWEVTDSFQHGSRTVRAGAILSIRGVRGRWRFIRHTRTNDDVCWIDCAEVFPANGLSKKEPIRAFRPAKIMTVHRTKVEK